MKNISDKTIKNTSAYTIMPFSPPGSGLNHSPAETIPRSDTWLSATGPVPIRMSNDYLFRALLQRSNSTLKGLICALLHLRDEEVISVDILNPIELRAPADAKTFFLDIKVSLNSRYHLS